MIASSIAALGGLALATYQVLSPSKTPTPTPIQVSVAVDPAKSGDTAVAVKQDGTLTSAVPAQAAVQQVADAEVLLTNMRSSLALLSAELSVEKAKPSSHRVSAFVA